MKLHGEPVEIFTNYNLSHKVSIKLNFNLNQYQRIIQLEAGINV